MIVMTTFYNAGEYIERCVGSLMGQTFKDFKCYLIDDMSTDDSVQKIKDMVQGDKRFVLVINNEKTYKNGNYVKILNELPEIDENDVVVELDGDDWLPESKVLGRINEVYQDKNIWITNGSFKYSSGSMGFSSPQTDFNKLRTDRFTATHLRTWRVFLWRSIRDEDHKDLDGVYWKVNGDLAYMLPMLEMSGSEHYKFLPDINLMYNEENPLNDHKVDMNLVNVLAVEIRNREQYKKLVR
jgi:glycosyltransferase involved in cell wall biosynthesis